MSASCLSAKHLQSFLGGGLSPNDEEQVTDHVQACRQCELELAILSDDPGTRTIARRERPPLEADGELLDDLMRRVEAATLLEQACAEETVQSPRALAEPSTLFQLGRYRILRELGRGTFGIVYLAEDERLWRNVALKVARAGVMADPQLRERFFREAEALARVAHPNIVPVYEVGETEGKCYLVVGYCDGPTLEEWLQLQSQPTSPRGAAQILIPLAEAADYAHSQGILHRDIKPANILLHPAAEQNEGELPFVPQLTDFGMAKFVEERNQATLAGVVLGTPQFMAPEQAAGHTQRIGPPTDVYALGAVLYRVLAGRPPIEGNSTVDTLRRVLIDEPPEVCAVAGEVPADLGAIVMKCLEKSPSQRYRSARELADDLRNYLSGRPTIARPLGPVPRAARWIRRNPLLTALLTLAAAVALLSFGVWNFSQQLTLSRTTAALESHRASTLARKFESSTESVAQRDYVHDIRAAAHDAFLGNRSAAAAALKRSMQRTDGPQLRGWEWNYLWTLAARKPLAEANAEAEIYHIALSPDEGRIVTGGRDGWLRMYDSRTLNLVNTTATEHGEVNSIAFAPDGRRFATAGDDGAVRVWDADSLRQMRSIAAHSIRAYSVAFYDDGQKLATSGKDDVIRLWNVATGEALGTLDGHEKSVDALAVSPDGTLLASAGSDTTAKIWDLPEQRAIHTLKGHGQRLSGICFSHHGDHVATASHDRTVALWEVSSGRKLGEQTFPDAIQSIAFSAHDERLFVGDSSGTLRRCTIVAGELGELRLGLELKSPDDAWAAHAGRLWSVAAAHKRSELFSAGKDGLLRRWQAHRPEPMERVLPTPRGDRFADLEFTEDGQSLLALRETGGISVLDLKTLKVRRTLLARAGQWCALKLLSGRDEVVAATSGGVVAIWNWKTGELQRMLQSSEGSFTVGRIDYSAPLGLIAVLPLELNDVRLYEAASGRYVGCLPTHNHSALAISQDGLRLAVDASKEVWVYDLKTRERTQVLTGHSGSILALAFSPDGATLTSGGSDRSVRFWSREGNPLHVIQDHYAGLWHLNFTPDGKTLFAADGSGVLKAIHVATARAMFDVPVQMQRIRAVAVSPTGGDVSAIGYNGELLVIHGEPTP